MRCFFIHTLTVSKMLSEPFREVRENDMPKVLKALEDAWPKHFIFHQLLTVLEDYMKKGCEWKHSLYVQGDYNSGVFLDKLTIDLPGGEYINLFIGTTNPDLSAMEEALLNTEVIPWEKKNYCFNHINAEFSCLVQGVLAAHRLKAEIGLNTLFWYPPNKECKALPLPEDIVVEFLDGSYAEEMDKNWPYKYPGSELCHRENLEKNFGLGLFRRSDRKLVGSALSDYHGGICMLYCEPEVRGRGLATILVQRMVLESRRRGRIPYAIVVVGNKPSERLLCKTGFEVFYDVEHLDIDAG